MERRLRTHGSFIACERSLGTLRKLLAYVAALGSRLGIVVLGHVFCWVYYFWLLGYGHWTLLFWFCFIFFYLVFFVLFWCKPGHKLGLTIVIYGNFEEYSQ
ncbi:hypothetical protein ES288_A04G152100v1 [Gossypium darwinii]|uniref:Uncharacterized protein n=1 Tax=Gossypium darwinii TaxID=34276 RepID=A0A5D2GZK3_GOSDA|nr:hypothetical protein ES288_A04G152100v1 [Gossypium darwinii]